MPTAGTGKSHTLIGLGVAAIQAEHKVRYFTAADLVETLYHGRLADNTVGKIIESLLRVDLIILDLSRPCNCADPRRRGWCSATRSMTANGSARAAAAMASTATP